MSANQRRRFCVNWSVQGAILWRLVFYSCLYVAFAFFTLTAFHAIASMPNDDPGTLWDNMQAVARVNLLEFLIFLSIAPLFMRDMLKLTHRFVGPIVRIRRALKQLANGETIAPVKLRKGDEWTELADEVNKIAERLQEKPSEPHTVLHEYGDVEQQSEMVAV